MRSAFVGRAPGLPFAFVLLALLAVACGGSLDDHDDAAPALPDQGGEGVAAPAPGTPGEGDSQQFADAGRKIVRTATISLVIDDLDDALTAVRAAARQAGGFVAGSNIVIDHAEDEEVARPSRAVVTIRVPASQFEDVMETLRTRARGVDSEDSSVREVTSEYTDLEARLRNLTATETQYVTLLDRAASISEIITVQDKLDGVRLQVEQIQGQLNVLDNQTDLATITVSLRVATAPIAVTGEPHWSVQAWEASIGASMAVLIVLGTLAIVGTVASVWVIPVAVATLFAWKRVGPAIAAAARRLN